MASPTKAKPAGKKPVTAHPLFPAIVALWFAALIGIGSLILPQTLYDNAGAAMGLGTLGLSARIGVALAAGIAGGALGMFLARKAAGSQSGAQGRAVSAADRGSSSVRPISAMEELGSDRLDDPLPGRAPDAITGRRRSLSVTDEAAPSDYVSQVPLPGGETTLDLIGADQVHDDDALELGHFEDQPPTQRFDFDRAQPAPKQQQIFQPPISETPLDLAEPDAHVPFDGVSRGYDDGWSVSEDLADPASTSGLGAPKSGQPFAEPGKLEPRPFSAMPSPSSFDPAPAPLAPEPRSEAQSAPFSMPFAAPVPVSTVPAEQSSAELAPIVHDADALAAAARPAVAPFTMPSLPSALVPASDTSVAIQPEASAKAKALSGTAMPQVALADLIDRFAAALRRADPATLTHGVPAGLHQFAPDASAAEPVTGIDPSADESDMAAPADSEAAPEKQAAAAPAPFGFPSLPAALQPIGCDEADEGMEDDDDDHVHDFGHPFAMPSMQSAHPLAALNIGPQTQPDAGPAAVHAAEAPFAMPHASESSLNSEDGDGEAGDPFGSLLAMKSGFGPAREFVRIDDEDEPVGGIEPVVTFPGTASPGRAAPAADGPSRDPGSDTFAPAAPSAPSGFARLPFGAPQPVGSGEVSAADRSATEQALRDALAKLQQMSGAA